MTSPRLNRLLRRGVPPLAETLDGLLGADHALVDLDGTVLAGGSEHREPGVPITSDGTTVGHLVGSDAEALAGLLTSVLSLDSERRAIADDALARYRELSLLYGLSAALTDAPGPGAVAERALAETARLLPMTAAVVAHLDGAKSARSLASIGEALHPTRSPIVEQTLCADPLAEHGEVLDETSGDARVASVGEISTLAIMPLRTDSLNGLLILGRQDPPFRSGDLKLLDAVASQTAPALAAALAAQQAAEAADARSRELERQVADLRIELDQARQQAGVEEITEAAYFKDLAGRADRLRGLVDDTT